MATQALPSSFYQNPDVVDVAKKLVGKVLCTRVGRQPTTAGVITETEAYCGRGDRACHANNGTRTDRTETMYQAGGIAYVYLCYGIHHLFNVVTNTQDWADAVLIRALKPIEGINTMLKRRNAQKVTPSLTAGPGRLTQALKITTDWDGQSLSSNRLWIEDRGYQFKEDELMATQRIGVDYAGEDAELPWRFYPKNSKWVSKK